MTTEQAQAVTCRRTLARVNAAEEQFLYAKRGDKPGDEFQISARGGEWEETDDFEWRECAQLPGWFLFAKPNAFPEVGVYALLCGDWGMTVSAVDVEAR